MKRLGRTVALASQLGISMGLMGAGVMVLGLLAGKWVDARWGTAPFATMFCTLAGALAGQIAIYRWVKHAVSRLPEQEHVYQLPDVFSALRLAVKTLALMIVPVLVGIGTSFLITQKGRNRIIVTLISALVGLVAGLAGSLHAARSVGGEQG
ncbi:MAG: AtpZ/AtpI family protein [Chloroflexota bacterium]|nr:AtpZ/AtpI family protein [Chloroflexota bacterium]